MLFAAKAAGINQKQERWLKAAAWPPGRSA
jgi:hypothetical protein